MTLCLSLWVGASHSFLPQTNRASALCEAAVLARPLDGAWSFSDSPAVKQSAPVPRSMMVRPIQREGAAPGVLASRVLGSCCCLYTRQAGNLVHLLSQSILYEANVINREHALALLGQKAPILPTP